MDNERDSKANCYTMWSSGGGCRRWGGGQILKLSIHKFLFYILSVKPPHFFHSNAQSEIQNDAIK